MTRAQARGRLLVTADAMGAAAASRRRDQYADSTPVYLTHRVALAAGVGALREADARAWAADVAATYRSAVRRSVR